MMRYAKAIWAAAISGLGAAGTALVDDQAVTAVEWITIAIATLTALGVVFQVENRPS